MEKKNPISVLREFMDIPEGTNAQENMTIKIIDAVRAMVKFSNSEREIGDQKIRDKITELEAEKVVLLSEYLSEGHEGQSILADRNMQISFQLKFLKELL